MRKFLFLSLLGLFLCVGSTQLQANTPKHQEEYTTSDSAISNIARGTGNLLTCWLEIPRCMVYDSVVSPFFGTIVGIPEGAGFTVARLTAGLVDLFAGGQLNDGIHGRYLPKYVWQARWIPAN